MHVDCCRVSSFLPPSYCPLLWETQQTFLHRLYYKHHKLTPFEVNYHHLREFWLYFVIHISAYYVNFKFVLHKHYAGEPLLFQAIRVHKGLAFYVLPSAFGPFATDFLKVIFTKRKTRSWMAGSAFSFKNPPREGQPDFSKYFIFSGFWGFVWLTPPFLVSNELGRSSFCVTPLLLQPCHLVIKDALSDPPEAPRIECSLVSRSSQLEADSWETLGIVVQLRTVISSEDG